MSKSRAHNAAAQEEAFTQYPVPRVLAKFIVPAALSQLTFLILNLADAFFVGRTNDTFQISSMAITFPVVMLISCVGTIFGAGANANMAAELGKGNRERAKTFSAFSVYTSAGVVILLSVILLAAKNPILYMIGADDSPSASVRIICSGASTSAASPWCCPRCFPSCFWQRASPRSPPSASAWPAR